MFVEIGERIRAAREDRGWTQAQLGEAIGYSQATIGNYELGRRHIGIDDLYKISEALGKPYAYFIGADKQLEDQAKYEAETKVRRDMAGFVGVRMMPVLTKALANGVQLSPGDIETTIPVPREFGQRADALFYVSSTCEGSNLRKGDYVFVRRQDSGQLGQVVLGNVNGCLGLVTCHPEKGPLWTGTGEAVGGRVTVIGEFCGLYTYGGFAVSAIQMQEPPAGWAELPPEDRNQVQQFIEFLRARRLGT